MKKLNIFLAACLTAIQASAQTTVGDVWKAMPDSILPYFNSAARTEIIDVYKINKESKVKNLLGGESWIKDITDRCLEIQLNKVTSLQMQLLPTTDSTNIVCMVKTYGTQQKESEIKFYNTDWSKADGNFSLPDFSDRNRALEMLTQKPDTISEEKFKKLQALIEPAVVEARLDNKGNGTITFSISGLLLTKEEENELNCIKKQKSVKWDGKTFK